MPKKKSHIPSYRLHKPSGQARVIVDGRQIYLGKFNSPQSIEAYNRLIAEHLAGACSSVDDDLKSGAATTRLGTTIVELALAYWRFAEGYYKKNGEPTGHLPKVQIALRILRGLYGSRSVADFKPQCLKAIQQSLIAKGNARTYINDVVSTVRRVFKWGVAEGIVPVAIYQALVCVPGLKKGRCQAREPDPVLPVSDADFQATLPHMPKLVADMARIQRLTGMRPGEVCALRPCDIDRSVDPWRYVPVSHKTEHHGRQRVVFLGPQAQSLLLKYLVRDGEANCFRPCDSEAKRRRVMRQNRKSKVQPSQKDRRKKRPKTQTGLRYTKDGYNRAIARACAKAWPAPEGLAGDALKQWRREHSWSPNQLRHATATEIRSRFGLEAAQTYLGHSRADVTQIYAERDLALAARVAKEVG